MTLINQIHRGKRPAPRRTTLYGVGGVGKSTWASMADNPIFIPTEDGVGEIDVASFPLVTTFGQVIDCLVELYENNHDFKTVCIDSLDWLERLIFADVCLKRGAATIEDIGYAKGYVYALEQWRQVLEGIEALRTHRAMACILIAHARIERFDNPETEPYDRYVPRLHRLASALITEWSDEVFFATYRVFTKVTDEGFNRTRTQGIGTGERIIRTTERPAHIAKNRLNLPDELPLDYREYAKYLPTVGTNAAAA